MNTFNRRLDAIAHQLAQRPHTDPAPYRESDVDAWMEANLTADEWTMFDRIATRVGDHPDMPLDLATLTDHEVDVMAAIAERFKQERRLWP